MDLVEATGWTEAALVIVAGDVDYEDAERLRSGLLAAVGDARAGLVVDLAGVQFIGSAGLAALVTVSTALAAEGRWVRLLHPSYAVRRLLEIAGAQDHFLVGSPDPLLDRDERFDERASPDTDGVGA